MAAGHIWYSFDLDYTLIRYKPTLHRLIFECAVRYLVEVKGYDTALLKETYDGWSRFVAKGIILDEQNGTMVQLDKNKMVIRATKGTQSLTPAEVKVMYPAPMDFTGLSDPGKYFSLTTGFEMPLAAVYALVTSGLPAGLSKDDDIANNQTVCQHMRDSLNFNFLVYEDQGWFFPAIRANPLEYVIKRTDVKEWLEHLRDEKDHRLMLITNSMPEYTNLLMNAAFGQDWKKIFDLVLVRAAKPMFFSKDAASRPFVEFKWGGTGYIRTGAAALRLTNTSCFAEGNSKDLIEFLNTEVHAGEVFNVLYFGDHMVGDVHAPRLANWKTVAVVEELEHQELHGVGWVHSRTLLNNTGAPLVSQAAQEHWTPYLSSDEGPTFWGAWAQAHADVIVPCISTMISQDLNAALFGQK